jgi:putative ABC transport system permease protein
MRFDDYLRLAFRNIRRQKLRSTLTIFAVVIGVTSVTIMLALVTGAKNFFLTQVEANGTLQQVAISSKTDITNFNDAQHNGGSNNCDTCVKLNDALVDKIKSVQHVTGVARIAGNGTLQAISYSGQKLTTEQTTAYDANGIITNNILAGRDIEASDTIGVITITSDYADKFGYKNNYQSLVGKQVQLETQNFYTGVGATIQPPQQGPGTNNQGPNQQPTTLTATIVGVADTANNSATIRVPLEWMRQMNESQMYQFTAADQAAQQAAQAACNNTRGPCNQPQQHLTLVVQDMLAQNGYSSLIAKVDNSKNAATAATAIKRLGVGAADAQASINQQLTIFNIIGLVLGGIGGIALAVAAIGVVNTMIMAILERTREIGVMRAVGAKRSTVRTLFTLEASMLGFLGGVIGVGFGFGLTKVANIIVNKQLASQGVKVHNIIGLPVWLIVTVIGIATLIGMLAGLYPAARAAKLDPVEALRYE